MATSIRMSADHIASAGFEPQRKNNFMLTLTAEAVAGVDSRIVELILHSVTFPKEELTVIEAKQGNETVYIPGTGKTLPFTVVFVDYNYSKGADFLKRWISAIRNPITGKVETKGGAAGTGTLKLLSPAGSVVKTWKLIDIWPSFLDLGDGSMDDAGTNLVEAVFQCDRFEGKSSANNTYNGQIDRSSGEASDFMLRAMGA